MFNLLQRGEDALLIKKEPGLSGTGGLSKDKRAFMMALGADAGRYLAVNWRRTTKDGVLDHFRIRRDLVPCHSLKMG